MEVGVCSRFYHNRMSTPSPDVSPFVKKRQVVGLVVGLCLLCCWCWGCAVKAAGAVKDVSPLL